MLNSLHSRLIFSYVFVVFLTLAIAGVGLLVLLQSYQQGITIHRLEAGLGPAAASALSSQRQGRTPQQLVADMQDQLDRSWLVLLVDDRGVILADSQGGLVGRILPRVLTMPADIGVRRFISGEQRVAGRTLVYAAAPIVGSGEPREFLVLATVERPFLGALEDIAGSLTIAGAVAMAVALLIGLILASSISGPIGRLTRATEAIAQGDFDERIPEEGSDVVRRLAMSYNVMTRTVKH
jgi:methyl-accepting chemotaxis protein